MRTIWKYELTLTNLRNGIKIPHEGKILDIQEQNGVPCMWVLLDSDETRMDTLEVYGTGLEMPNSYHTLQKKYIATVQYLDGKLVFHLFL